jgi:hypothetical protein
MIADGLMPLNVEPALQETLVSLENPELEKKTYTREIEQLPGERITR